MKKINYQGITQSPKEFLKDRTFMSSLNKAEAEEFLRRILRFCLEKNVWVAPTPQEIDDQVKADFAQARETDEIRERNRHKRKAYEKAAKWNWLRRLMGREEVPNPDYEEEKETPFTLLTINPNALKIGLQYMREHDFIRIDEEDGEVYLIATEKALQSMPIVG